MDVSGLDDLAGLAGEGVGHGAGLCLVPQALALLAERGVAGELVLQGGGCGLLRLQGPGSVAEALPDASGQGGQGRSGGLSGAGGEAGGDGSGDGEGEGVHAGAPCRLGEGGAGVLSKM